MRPGIRAASDKELPQDHVPFDFGLLPVQSLREATGCGV